MYEFAFQPPRGLNTCHLGKAQLVVAAGENGNLRREPRVPVKIANFALVLRCSNSAHLGILHIWAALSPSLGLSFSVNKMKRKSLPSQSHNRHRECQAHREVDPGRAVSCPLSLSRL